MTARAAAPPLSVTGTLRALRVPRARDLLLSIKATIAVIAALLVGFSQNLDNPYWSALTIYVLIAQPQAGAIRSKAIFRLAGTVMGGTAAIILAAAFGSHVGVELVATLAAILLAFYLKTLDRTPTSYTWFATALTLAVIGIIHAQQPDAIFRFATTRMLEISIGILAIGIVDSLLLPQAGTPSFVMLLDAWYRQAATWMASTLAEDAPMDLAGRRGRRQELRRIAALLGPLDAQAVQLPFDTVPVPPRARDLRYLRLIVARLLAHFASANLWIEAARRSSSRDAEAAAASVRDWIGDGATCPVDAPDRCRSGEALLAQLQTGFAETAASGGREQILQASVQLRLGEVVHHWLRFEAVMRAVGTGGRLPAAFAAEARRAAPVRSIDGVVALLDNLPLAVALGGVAIVWYVTAWTGGISAMLFAFVSLSAIIGTPGAVRSAAGTLVWSLLAFAVTFLYLFAFLPRVTTFQTLAAVLAMGTIPLGLLLSMSPAGVLILANWFAFLGLQNAYAADFETSLEALFGSLAGCLAAIGALFLCQYDRPRLRARRLLRAFDRDIVEAASARRPIHQSRLYSLGADRMAQYFGNVDALPEDDPLRKEDVVGRFRIAANMVALRGEEVAIGGQAGGALALLRRRTAEIFSHGPDDAPAVLRPLVEQTYRAVLLEGPSERRARALAGLVGLDLALSPDPAFERAIEGDGL